MSDVSERMSVQPVCCAELLDRTVCRLAQGNGKFGVVHWYAGWTCGVKTVLEKADSVDADAPIDRDGDDIDILVVVKQSRLRVASMT